jgi:hypothetical protein
VNDFIRSLHSEFPDHAVPKRREGYQIKKIPCCYLLNNPALQHTVKLNETSLLLWELCNGSLSVGEILELLVENFPQAESIMRRDVFRVLDEFVEEEVITISRTGA